MLLKKKTEKNRKIKEKGNIKKNQKEKEKLWVCSFFTL